MWNWNWNWHWNRQTVWQWRQMLWFKTTTTTTTTTILWSSLKCTTHPLMRVHIGCDPQAVCRHPSSANSVTSPAHLPHHRHHHHRHHFSNPHSLLPKLTRLFILLPNPPTSPPTLRPLSVSRSVTFHTEQNQDYLKTIPPSLIFILCWEKYCDAN